MASSKAKIPVGVVDVEVSGDTRAVDTIIENLLESLKGTALSEGLLGQRVYNILQERARLRFAAEGDDVSGPWASLRPFTQEQRRRGGFGATGPINVRHGRLRDHVLNRTPDAERHSLGATLWFPKRGGSKDSLSKVQVAQSGLDKPKTPARPVLGVNENDVELILQATAAHIASFQGAGGGRLFP